MAIASADLTAAMEDDLEEVGCHLTKIDSRLRAELAETSPVEEERVAALAAACRATRRIRGDLQLLDAEVSDLRQGV